MHACISCAVPQDMADQGGDGGEGYGAGVSRSSSIRSVTAAASELLKRRQSLTGSPAGPAAGIDFDAHHSVVLQQKLSQSAKPPARRPRSSTSSGSRFYADKVQRARCQDFQQKSVTVLQRVSTF
eukprot:Tamp_22197.p1 GENE.Tamp_22197~~Tamp_22197.p1  ORF type:complete len:125 (+),score=11.14 Tamp_22197:316-690(+)